jgi:glycosyltransferase involved in cell wall biosynthesis
MAEPLVSVVIPAYNYGQFVTAAVDSALAQTYRNVEVLVIDDGSTDDTRRKLEPYGDRIRYHYQENQGLSGARNTGIRLARGEFIAPLDADDLWHPRKLEVQMRVFERRPEVALVASRQQLDFPSPWFAIEHDVPPPEQEISLEDVLVICCFGPSSVILRRDCLGGATPFDPTLRSVQDRELWIRIAAGFPIVRIELPLVYYRLHGNNMSLSAERMEYEEQLVVSHAFRTIPRLRGRWLLRAQAGSSMALSAALRYRAAGLYGIGLRRSLRSMLLWPWPHTRASLLYPFIRPKVFAVTLLRWLFRPLRPNLEPSCPAGRPAGEPAPPADARPRLDKPVSQPVAAAPGDGHP